MRTGCYVTCAAQCGNENEAARPISSCHSNNIPWELMAPQDFRGAQEGGIMHRVVSEEESVGKVCTEFSYVYMKERVNGLIMPIPFLIENNLKCIGLRLIHIALRAK